jgi:two-component system LytT family response regulator
MPPVAPLRIAIVDDEDLARQLVREYLSSMPEVEVVAECANGFEAVKTVTERRPDLLLLDVQMPRLNGFEVVELVGRDVAVVFTTAHDEYALRAFEINAVDYLLKPFSAERLAEAIDRARERIARRERLPIAALAAAGRRPDTPTARVLVRDGARVHVIPIDTIDYIQAQDDYVAYRAGGKQYLKEQTLAEVEASLDRAKFVRIHRSYVLNLDRLARVELDERENRVATLTTGERLPVSRAGHARLTAALQR